MTELAPSTSDEDRSLYNIIKVPLVGGTPINLTLLVTSIYVVTYVMMDPIAGSLAATLVLLLHRFTFGRRIIIIALLSF